MKEKKIYNARYVNAENIKNSSPLRNELERSKEKKNRSENFFELAY